MRAVVPDKLVEERRRLGLDRRDEMWGRVQVRTDGGVEEV